MLYLIPIQDFSLTRVDPGAPIVKDTAMLLGHSHVIHAPSQILPNSLHQL